MANPTKASEDQRLKAFFRDAIQSEPGIERELAERMAERCVQSIDTVLAQSAQRAAAALSEEPVAAKSGFDPFAFSAVALLARKGRDELLSRLGEITEPEHLRQLATAQHIAIDPGLTRAEELRLAIVRGAERRMASRRAAAS